MRNLVILSLGSNVEPRLNFLNTAISGIKKVLNVVRISSIYESDPWGYIYQGKFLNLALVCFTNMLPFEVLREVKEIEKKVGRTERFKWGPREIDIDIVYYGRLVLKTSELIIPHPYRLDRGFVMLPIFEIAPNVLDPEYDIPVSIVVSKFMSVSQISTLLRSKFL
ncbi:MAG: 2-amino-4-hydroxy-6-hydroxymethyldihydropteridine diphosphokinase [Brevinematia bacterium]